jgi:hypothetical protein
MHMSPVGLRSEKGCAGDARQKPKSTHSTSRQRGRPHINKPETILKKVIKGRMGKIGRGLRWVPDTKTEADWLSVVI